MKKKKINIKKLIIAALILIGIVCLLLWIFKKNQPVEVNVNATDNMSTYGYSIPDNATDYYKSLYKELQTNLNGTEVNEEEYARSITKLFLTDFFTLSNKVTKSDIGGVQFVYSSYQDDFMKYAKDGIYNVVQSNLDGNRKQDLPTIKSVEITKLSNEKYTYQDKTDEKAYDIKATMTYEKDMDYQTDAELVIIHTDKKLEIVVMK
jgi:hypothetical protein